MNDDNYLTRNARSKAFATHDGESWTAEEEALLLARWPDRTLEEDVARDLGRTIASCRQRYSILTAKGTGPKRPHVVEVVVQVCTGCWTALPCTGVCDNCEEES